MWLRARATARTCSRPSFRTVGLGLARGVWNGRAALFVTADFGCLTRAAGTKFTRLSGFGPSRNRRARPDNGLCMSDFQVKRIILPSGKAVEIVYLQSAPGATRLARRDARSPRRSSCVPSATASSSTRLAWHELSPGRWEIERRCPECEWERPGVHGEADVQRYDALLNEGTDALIEHVEQLAHDNMAAEIERFVAALRDDHITPFDF